MLQFRPYVIGAAVGAALTLFVTLAFVCKPSANAPASFGKPRPAVLVADTVQTDSTTTTEATDSAGILTRYIDRWHTVVVRVPQLQGFPASNEPLATESLAEPADSQSRSRLAKILDPLTDLPSLLPDPASGEHRLGTTPTPLLPPIELAWGGQKHVFALGAGIHHDFWNGGYRVSARGRISLGDVEIDAAPSVGAGGPRVEAGVSVYPFYVF